MIIDERKVRKAIADVLTPKNIKIFIFILFFIILFILKKNFFIVLFFVALGAVSMIYRLFVDVGIGFELCTLSTVLVAMKFGSKLGILVGFLCVTIGLALNTRLFRHPIDSLYHVIGFCIIGYVASFFALENIFGVGMIIVVVYNLIYFPFRLLFGSNVIKLLIYSATNIFFNYIIFKSLAPLFIRMLG